MFNCIILSDLWGRGHGQEGDGCGVFLSHAPSAGSDVTRSNAAGGIIDPSAGSTLLLFLQIDSEDERRHWIGDGLIIFGGFFSN